MLDDAALDRLVAEIDPAPEDLGGTDAAWTRFLAGGPRRSRWPRRPDLTRASRRTMTTGLLGVALITGGTAGALAVTSAGPFADPVTTPLPGGTDLAVFARPATPADALPAGFAAMLTSEFRGFGPIISDSRRVSADDGQTVYLTPESRSRTRASASLTTTVPTAAASPAQAAAATNGVCVINTNEAFCTPASASAGATVADVCSPELPVGLLEIEWLIPDGASDVELNMSNGSIRSYPAGSNVYIARLPRSPGTPVPTSVSWSSDGVFHTVTSTVPLNAGSSDCATPAETAAAGAQARARHSPHVTRLITLKPQHRP